LGIAAPSKQFLLNLFPLTAAIFASPSEGPPYRAAETASVLPHELHEFPSHSPSGKPY
jgi:hypothetical protein